MKIKKKTALAAAVFTAAMNFSACDNYADTVYGPPSETPEYTETVSNDDNSQSEEENASDASEETKGDEQQ